MHVACGGDPYTVNDQQRSREESFVNKTREIVVHIVTKRFEKPQMFMVRFDQVVIDSCTCQYPTLRLNVVWEWN